MSNKFVLLLIFLITAVFISGCIDGNKTPVNTTGQSLIPTTGLPAGFTYMGTHDVEVEIGGKSVNATEGVYRKGEDDIYIQVIGTENPGALLEQYKADFKKKFGDKYNPFEDISLNGHTATKVADFTVMKGQPVTVYSVTWTIEKSMVIVGSSSNLQEVKDLATATGH
ncbi:Uncharacterised protein [uncultured archaeon]|nr:Uncharacterised protein [uncultured archaeon]